MLKLKLMIFFMIQILCRYEWSIGYTGYTSPKGIYDNDKVWQDSGQLMDAVFTMEKGL